MSNAKETISEESLQILADETLQAISTVAELAGGQLQNQPVNETGVIINQSIDDKAKAEARLREIGQAERKAYAELKKTPLLSRVEVCLSTGEKKVYFIARHAAPPGTGLAVASYNSPVGRLASIEPGDFFVLPNDEKIEVINTARLRTRIEEEKWDSINTVFDNEQGPITIKSLRSVLEQFTDAVELEEGEQTDFLGEILNNEAQQTNTIDGVQRQILQEIGIREQAILDKYQDEIFRLPIDSKLLVLGAPGTGKTTTLIRRLGQKTNAEFIRDYSSEDERELIQSIAQTSRIAHADNWLMFSPTELLRLYLKEAFNRESVPASDDKIQTWDDYRLQLARTKLHLLKTGSTGTGLILANSSEWLRADATKKPISWYNDFQRFNEEAVFGEIQEAAQQLANFDDEGASELSQFLETLLHENSKKPVHTRLLSIASKRDLVRETRKRADDTITSFAKNILNNILANEKDYFESLSEFTEELYRKEVPAEESAEDDLEEEQTEEQTEEQQKIRTFNRFKSAIVYVARQKTNGKKVNKKSRQGQIADFLGEENWPNDETLKIIYDAAELRALVSKVSSPVQRYFNRLPSRYLAFREQRKKDDKWYLSVDISNRHVDPLELDILILTALTETRALILTPNVFDRVTDASVIYLQNIQALYRTQIVVDEVTDFSPLQVACMGLLSNPESGSFFACGDFNQRLTSWGSTTLKDIKWAIKDIDVRRIEVAYRQSSELNALAQKIIDLQSGDKTEITMPRGYAESATRPALSEDNTEADIVDWLARQIGAVEKTLGELPSVAVFVPDNSMVKSMADQLQVRLQENNIPVVPCLDGKSVGQDSQVRVFDIQHIKGLEFEAVFFPYIDKLAKDKKDLFDKYIYVGCTRAATFLGIACENRLPSSLELLREHFIAGWDTP